MHPKINRAIFAAFAVAAISLISLSTLFSNHVERALADDPRRGTDTELVQQMEGESPGFETERPFVRTLQPMPSRLTR